MSAAHPIPPPTPLRVAVIGCGQIADAHLWAIRKIGVTLAGVCDAMPDLATQAAQRFETTAYRDIDVLMKEGRPDVVHLATPAHTHAALAERLVRLGVHVYVEKPFTTTVEEADHLVATARAARRLVCAGHDQLYDPVWVECRRLVDTGRIGEVLHVEAHLGYSLDGPFGAAVSADPQHWVRRLPGGLFQNTVSHPLYKITDFLVDEAPEVWADCRAFESGTFPSELRLLLRGRTVTGWLFFSSRLPAWHRTVRVYGSERMLDVDFEFQVVRESRAASSRGPLTKMETPWRQTREAIRRLQVNVGRFRRAELHYFAGMETLLRRFYDAVLRGADEPPVSYLDARRVTWIMEQAFAQCAARQSATAASDL